MPRPVWVALRVPDGAFIGGPERCRNGLKSWLKDAGYDPKDYKLILCKDVFKAWMLEYWAEKLMNPSTMTQAALNQLLHE